MSVSLVPGPSGPLWIGRYERIERLGHGPTCEVHLARTVRRDGEVALVALKLPLAGLAEDPAFVERFLASARRAEALMHPGIARVLDVSKDPALPFVAAEYVHGEHVAAILRRLGSGERPLDIFLRVIVLAAQALEHAHGAREPLVHGSLTPQNLFVQYDGEVRVADFCAPRAPLGPTDAITREHGGVAYWSPEQASGKPFDTASDVFSLGVIMWECLTQRSLFRGATRAETLELVKTCAIQPPSELVDCPAALDRIVRRCLEKDPHDRPPTAGALAEELDILLERRRRDASPAAIRALMHSLFSQRQAGRDATLRRALHPSRESYAPLAAASPSLIPPASRASRPEPLRASPSPPSTSTPEPTSASPSTSASASTSTSPSASPSSSASPAPPAAASPPSTTRDATPPGETLASTSPPAVVPAEPPTVTMTTSASPARESSTTPWIVAAVAAACLLVGGIVWALSGGAAAPIAAGSGAGAGPSGPGSDPTVRDPVPVPDSIPVPVPVPVPVPDPDSVAVPDPVPDPVDPDPLPDPDAVPDPDPLPDPDAVPEPEQVAALRPQDMASLEVVCRPAVEIFLENRSLGLSPRVVPVVPGTLAVGLRSTGPEHRWRTIRRDVAARGTLSIGLSDCP